MPLDSSNASPPASGSPEVPAAGETSTEGPVTPAPRIQRLRISFNVAVQILLVLVLFGLANYLAARHFRQWDHTFDRKFTLADSTIAYLKTVTVPITITALTVRGSEPEKDLSALLQQYREHMKGRVEIKVIDTRRDVQAYESFKAQVFKSRISVESNGILVQAEAPVRDKGSPPPVRYITEDLLYEVDPATKTATAFKGESLLNSAIRAVTTVDRPLVGVVAGLGTWRRQPDLRSVLDTLTEICTLNNIDLQPFRITDAEEEDPARFNALVWVSPGDIFEREEEILRRYFETPGRSLLLMLNPANPTPRLDQFLATYGIAPQEDRVLTARSSPAGPIKRFDVDARFLDGSPWTAKFIGQSTLFLDQTRSLKLLGGTDKMRAENIDVKPLLSPPADVYWGEKEFSEPLPKFDSGSDNGAPLYIAASAERGAARDPRVQVKSSRLLVVGNSAFADPGSISPVNYDFLGGSLDWLLHRDTVAPNDSATDKRKHRFRILIKPEQWQRVFWTTTIILPLAALMTGVMVWSSRRN